MYARNAVSYLVTKQPLKLNPCKTGRLTSTHSSILLKMLKFKVNFSQLQSLKYSEICARGQSLKVGEHAASGFDKYWLPGDPTCAAGLSIKTATNMPPQLPMPVWSWCRIKHTQDQQCVKEDIALGEAETRQ